MSCHWMCLSLLCILQHRVSADQGVELKCNKTVKAGSGESVTLRCSIKWTLPGQICVGKEFHWHHTDDNTNLCDSTFTEYSCDWDNRTYVSLKIEKVSKEQNYTVGITSKCGMDDFHFITVQLNSSLSPSVSPFYSRDQQDVPSYVTAICLSALASAIVAATLFITFTKYRKSQENPPRTKPTASFHKVPETP